MKYSDKLRDPRWQKKRLEIFQRDVWKCARCDNSKITLHVHHKEYIDGLDPWEYPDDLLETLCEYCHDKEGSKINQIDKFLSELGVKYRIYALPGVTSESPEAYSIVVSGFGRTWEQVL